MGQRTYAILRAISRHACHNCLHRTVLHRERLEEAGAQLLAVTHISHLEPVVIGVLTDRPIHWMARQEFFRTRVRGAILRHGLAFSVDRDGVPVRAIRHAVSVLEGGGTVGVFPEGEVATGMDSVMRGGPMKAGVCLISQLAQVPITPVVVFGTEKLNAVRPWIPYRRAEAHVAFGERVDPVPRSSPRRDARLVMTERLGERFRGLYGELLESLGWDDARVP